MKRKITRRGFGRQGFLATGALAATSESASAQSRYEFFSDQNAALADALADAIIPPDDEFAGGAEAGVADYLDKQLRGPLERFSPLYLLGLPALDATALRISAKGFLEMSPEERTALLEKVEAGEAEGPEWPEFSAQTFFRRAIQHAMQAYYGDPEHGGNKDRVSWKMLEIEDMMHWGGG